MEEKLRGVVLNSINYGENDKILTVFTLEKGVVTAKIKGVKKAGAKLKFASEPFCFAEFMFSFTSGKRTVIGASLFDSFYPLREDVEKYFSGGTMLEYTKRFLKEGIENEEFFLLLVDSLKNLSYGDENYKKVLSEFLINALKLSGFALNIGDCANCGKRIEQKVYFDFLTGSFYCEDCKTEGTREISIVTFNALIKLKNKKDISDEEGTKTLKLLEYYLLNRTEERISSLKELIKIM